jgi:hypothetical protein
MMITATHKVTRAEFQFDSDTATAATLDDVDNPARLPQAEKLAYFARRRALDANAKVALVKGHRDRLDVMLHDLWDRAPGPKDDDVHLQIKATALKITTVLTTYQDYARTSDKKFNEMDLIQELRAALVVLKGSVPDVAATQQHIAGLEKARRQVGDVLARAEAGIRAWVQGASIAYRGSLATGWRNENKSQAGTAQRINLLNFDSDAFVTIPHDTWAGWNVLKIVLDNKLQDKMSLSDLIVRADLATKSDPVKRARAQLAGIRKVEEQLQDAMKTVGGYKINQGGNADFEFVLQTRNKTVRELAAGNLYPLDQIAKAGLPLTERELKVVVEDGIFKVRMPERHVNMSETIGQPTYPTDPVSVPHVTLRPTERMAIEAYFNAPVPLTAVETAERSLVAHLGAYGSDNLTFNTAHWG